ncbi:MAG: hypothetical protein ACXVPY_12805, partial [Bacteroidia bacterium]
MLNNIALDVFIGLIFVFLIYSLLATVLQEIIARMLDLRGKNLVKAIRVMLEDREEVNGNYFSRLYQHIASNIRHFNCPFPKNSMAKAFYSHPAIKYLSQSSLKSKPSYMDSNSFSATIIKLLRGKDFEGKVEEQMAAIRKTLFETNTVSSGVGANLINTTIDEETREQLKQLFLDADNKIENFKTLLEQWFDQTMDRASGWYKKQTQFILFAIGLTIAITFNADTIAIYNILSKDKQAREEFVQLAEGATSKYDSLNKHLIKKSIKDSVAVLRSDSAGNKTKTWNYITKDSILLADTSLNTAKKMLLTDIGNANNILGLGRQWKDSCKRCKETMALISEINKNSSPEKKQQLAKLLSENNGVCTDKSCVNSRKCLQWHPLQRGGIV